MSDENKIRHGFLKNSTCLELLVGNVIFYLIGEIIILFFTDRILYISIGFTEGVVISAGMIIHMTIALEQAMHLNEKGAYVHVRKTAAIRLTVVLVIMIVIGIFDLGNIVAMLFGIMAMKVSAYLQPFTHKVLAKKITGKGR